MDLFGEWSKVSYSWATENRRPFGWFPPPTRYRTRVDFECTASRILKIHFRREVRRCKTRFYINLLNKQYPDVEQDSRTMQYLTQTTHRILNQPNQIHGQSIQAQIYLLLRNGFFHGVFFHQMSLSFEILANQLRHLLAQKKSQSSSTGL